MTIAKTSRARAAEIAAISVPILGIIALHRLAQSERMRIGWSDPIGWIRAADADQVLAAILGILGLGVCYWLAFSTIGYACAAITRMPASVRGRLARITPTVVRRAADRIAAGALAASTMAAPAALAMTDPPPAVVTLDPAEVHLGAGSASAPVGQVDRAFPPVILRSRQSDGERRSLEVEVHRGDTLWALAERRMTAALSRRPTSGEIGEYCSRIVAVNLPRLRSGNPDVIHPGEIIIMPETPDVGA